MKLLVLLATCFLAVATADDRRVPVIVELFTSEGCSSCPAADTLLAQLEKSQPVGGARVIGLEEHVDYWNQLGWVDPFSAPQYRARQNDYALAFRGDNIYTPQMVVNGQALFIGDDRDRAIQEITRAMQAQTAVVELRTTPNHDPEMIDLSVHVIQPRRTRPHDANVFLAVAENEIQSNVQRCENTGRTLKHGAVVRSFGIIGRIDSHGSSEGRINSTLRLPPEWRRENLHAVVFIQERDTFRITGEGIADLR